MGINATDDPPTNLLYYSPPEADSLREWLREFAAKQERLGPEFERALYDNLPELYAK